MSNICFDFLTESLLFHNSDNNFHGVSLKELAIELDNYREYVSENIEKIREEIINIEQDKLIQDDQLIQKEMEDIQRISSASLLTETFILADPIFDIFIDNISLNRAGNFLSHSFDEEEIKRDLADRINYMKVLSEGVRCDTEYIKFFPMSYDVVDIMPSKIRVPNLQHNFNNELIDWFRKKLRVYSVRNDMLDSPVKISDKIALQFDQNADMDYFFAQYISCFSNGTINSIDYYNWIDQEKRKAINDMYSFLTTKIKRSEEFHTTLYAKNEFQRDFFTIHNIKDSNLKNERFHHINMEFVGTFGIDFNTSMNLRRRYYNEFKRFREMLNEDLRPLKLANDDAGIDEYLVDLRKKYVEKSRILKQTLFEFNSISVGNIVPILTSIALYVNDKVGTDNVNKLAIPIGSAIAQELIVERIKKRENPFFFISKF